MVSLLNLGESLRIKALVQGRPVPRVTWFKDGVEIEEEDEHGNNRCPWIHQPLC